MLKQSTGTRTRIFKLTKCGIGINLVVAYPFIKRFLQGGVRINLTIDFNEKSSNIYVT